MNNHQETVPLSSLHRGEQGLVRHLTTQGPMRRRLQDIGLVPGALVERRGSSPGGDPTAYFVCGATIALRKEDAGGVLVEPCRRDDSPDKDTFTVALAGNPNVGKSTVFNALTGLNQHTGNWPGKTVSLAQGSYTHHSRQYRLVDLPGTYSLLAHSAEEEVARDFLCLSHPDAVVVVCDAGCLERNLNLVLQTAEITPRIVVCVNLMDEARKKGIVPDLALLSRRLGLPVVATSARSGEGLSALLDAVEQVCRDQPKGVPQIPYPGALEQAIAALPLPDEALRQQDIPPRWAALRLLMGDDLLQQELVGRGLLGKELQQALAKQRDFLLSQGFDPITLHDAVVQAVVGQAKTLCRGLLSYRRGDPSAFDSKLDALLTSRLTGIPIMLGLLGFILWLTIWAANIPSSLLSTALSSLGESLNGLLLSAGTPEMLRSALMDGVYRVLSWVIAVMLPPMAIFFPLFTLLEDFGYLPRVAFNLDSCFKKSCACGKQALTMCMGFGCNAVGVTGCRIIDSPRERLVAILTNNFVPCNGRFPTLIAMISMFFVTGGFAQSLRAAALLLGILVLGVALTLLCSRLLSKTLLKGVPSSFALELPPYRKPQVGRVLLRSLLDRTLFVLGRAAMVAAPAGLLLWILAHAGDGTLLQSISSFLDPLGRFMGLDGVILLAFLLGFPANEIVLPIALMIYLGTGTLQDTGSLLELRGVLAANGWTSLTALCTMLFSLLHFPCSTTCLTIFKETRSWGWTALAALLPTACGVILCMAVAACARLLGLA